MAQYWMNESSGILRPVVAAYLEGKDLSVYQIAVLRAYLSQWIMDAAWRDSTNVAQLRALVPFLKTKQDLDRWIDTALEDGIDPL